MKPDEQTTNYVTVATKITHAALKQLKRLCAAKNLSLYEMQQMSLWSFIRYMSSEHNLSAEMEELMSVFEHMDGWANAFNMADPDAQMSISEATYFLTAKDKNGTCAVHVHRPYFGDWSQDYNIQHIFERTLELLLPERYKRLRLLAGDMGCQSLLNFMDKLIDEHSKDADLAEIRRTFEDADRSEYGRKPVTVPYKRKLNRSMEAQPKLFDNDGTQQEISEATEQ